MIEFTEILDGDSWELFARDFFASLGFVIEIDPSRGPDGGRDLIVSEQLSGRLHTRKFTWLVSCKHNASSGKSVGVNDELNINERLKQHKCDGFLGFYSTMASSGLYDRLNSLAIQDYVIYDHKKIEGYFFDLGFSKIALRYFPRSYVALRPIQQIVDQHVKLECEICGCDWVKEAFRKPRMGIILSCWHENEYRSIDRVFVVCRGECDHKLEKKLHREKFYTGWQGIEDICNPLGFLKYCISYMNILHAGEKKYSKKAHETMTNIFIALSQRVLREVSNDDRRRLLQLIDVEGL